MDDPARTACIAFQGSRRIASGELREVALKAKEAIDRGRPEAVLIFDDRSGEPIEVDFRGTADDVLEKLVERGRREAVDGSVPPASPPRGPGRPKLGVVAREVTLLPSHWEWLNGQPGGASVALRKLVEEARRTNEGKDRRRRAEEAAYRFLYAMAGDRPGFEAATRALFAGDRGRFEAVVGAWPAGIRDQARRMADRAFSDSKS